MPNKETMKVYGKCFLNGFGATAAASTAIAWAFPKLAKTVVPTWARIACGLSGTIWCAVASMNLQECITDELYTPPAVGFTYNKEEDKDE